MNKILRFILSIIIIEVFLRVYGFLGFLGYYNILIINTLTKTSFLLIIIYYIILAIAGFFLGYECQSIIYKKLKIQSKYFFYIVIVLTLISVGWAMSVSKQADIQAPNTIIVSFLYIASFLTPFIIKRRWQNVEYQEET